MLTSTGTLTPHHHHHHLLLLGVKVSLLYAHPHSSQGILHGSTDFVWKMFRHHADKQRHKACTWKWPSSADSSKTCSDKRHVAFLRLQATSLHVKMSLGVINSFHQSLWLVLNSSILYTQYPLYVLNCGMPWHKYLATYPTVFFK